MRRFKAVVLCRDGLTDAPIGSLEFALSAERFLLAQVAGRAVVDRLNARQSLVRYVWQTVNLLHDEPPDMLDVAAGDFVAYRRDGELRHAYARG